MKKRLKNKTKPRKNADNWIYGYHAVISAIKNDNSCLLYTSPSPRDATLSRMPSSA